MEQQEIWLHTKELCKLSGKEVVVLIYAQDAEIDYDISNHDGFFTSLRRCFFNTDTTQEWEDSSDSNEYQESPIPPAVEDIACDNNKEVLQQKLVLTLAEGIIKDKPIEEKDYWEKDCELKWVE